MTNPKATLPPDLAKSVGATREPARPESRFYICKVCGQQVDSVKLSDVYYHDDKPHDPLLNQTSA